MKNKRMPFDEGTDRELFDNSFGIASMSECTGLIPTAPVEEGEMRSYSDIYDTALCDNLKNRSNKMDERNRNENKKNQNQNQNQNRNENKIDRRNDSSNRKDSQNNR